MDGTRFDSLTRALASTNGATSRRGFLKGIAAGLVAGALGWSATGSTEAACPPGQVNRRQIPSGWGCVCRTTGRPPLGGSCIPPAVGCPDDPAADLATDPLNCGACGNRCRAGETCGGGVCRCGDEICDAEFSCDSIGSGRCACTVPARGFFDPVSGDTNRDCPAPNTPCVGPTCAVCCPVGTGCDLTTGSCFQLT